jgi:hypothetical protein
MAKGDPVAEGTRGLIRGALVVGDILIIIFAGLFVVSKFRGGEGKSAANLVHTQQLA